eukprot:358760-Chlamydomonas_euryale.AAC.4
MHSQRHRVHACVADHRGRPRHAPGRRRWRRARASTVAQPWSAASPRCIRRPDGGAAAVQRHSERLPWHPGGVGAGLTTLSGCLGIQAGSGRVQ